VDPLDLPIPASPRQCVVIDSVRHRLGAAERTLLPPAQFHESPYRLVVCLLS
jgi:hypothetical protein